MGTQLNTDGTEDDSNPLNTDDTPGPLGMATTAAAPDSNVDLSSLHGENHQRYLQAQSEMDRLQKQYSDLSGQNADAYAQQKKMLQDATERLNSLSFAPSPEEQHYRQLAAFTDGSHGGYGFNPAEVNSTKADLLKEQREGEMQKAQLMSQYAMQIPQATIQANNQQINQNLGMQRVLGSQVNNSATAAERGNQALPWYIQKNADNTYSLKPGAEAAMDQQAMTKLFGRFTLVPQADGSKKIVSGASIAASAPKPAAQATTPTTPQTPNGPALANTNAPKAPATPNQPSSLVTPTFLASLFQPSNILPAKYGSLTQATKPAYVQAGMQAFDPAEFSQYKFTPDWLTNNKAAMTKEMETKDKDLGAAYTGAQNTINNYGHALTAIDSLQNDPKLMTGPFGEKKAALENVLRGALGDDLTGTILNDPQLKALEAKQDSDKYFRQAATAGLQAVYHGRITNQELSTQLSSLPSSNLMPAVARLLSKAQSDVAQDTVNKAKLWPVYKQKGGTPGLYDGWYDAHFSPFSTDSVLTKTLQKAQSPTKPQIDDATKAALAKYGVNIQ